MRDYVQIIEDLRSEGTPTSLAGAEALEELHGMARRMTSLGVDLENQIQEDLTPDFYAILKDDTPLTLLIRSETLRDMNLPYQLPAKFTAMKIIGESWIVRFPGDDEPTEFFSRDALNQAVAEFNSKQGE